MLLPSPSSRSGQDGFTLLEVLIAVTLTAVIGLGVWQVINGVVNSRDRVNELAEQFDALQQTMLLLERDILQVVNRPARDLFGDFQPALSSRDNEFALLLTRQGWRNPLGLRRSGLQRVGWEHTGTELRRRYWPMVDQGQEDDSRDRLVLEGVTRLQVRFLDSDRTWRTEWPTDELMAAMMPGNRPDAPLPLGLELTLEHQRFGILIRTFALPDFDSGLAQGAVNRGNDAQASAADEAGATGSSATGQGG